MYRTFPRVAPLVTMLVAGLLLGGCAGTTSASTPAPTSTPTMSATPAPSVTVAPAPSTIVIHPDRTEIMFDDDTVAFSFGYFERAENVVPTLTDIFDSEPVMETVDRTNEPTDAPSYDSYTWDGFVYYEELRVSDTPARADHWVRAIGTSAHSLTIATTSDVSVGDPFGPVEADFADTLETFTRADGTTVSRVSVSEVVVPDGYDENGNQWKWLTTVEADSSENVTTIYAPTYNFGL